MFISNNGDSIAKYGTLTLIKKSEGFGQVKYIMGMSRAANDKDGGDFSETSETKTTGVERSRFGNPFHLCLTATTGTMF